MNHLLDQQQAVSMFWGFFHVWFSLQGPAMSPGMESVAAISGSLPGLVILSLGQAMVVVCVCFDMVRALSVPGSQSRYVASTVFRTLAVPSVISLAVSVLVDLVMASMSGVGMAMFVLVAIIFRLHHDKDEDNWWKGKGKKLARWARRRFAGRVSGRAVAAPALG